jgi:hypothetical protein
MEIDVPASNFHKLCESKGLVSNGYVSYMNDNKAIRVNVEFLTAKTAWDCKARVGLTLNDGFFPVFWFDLPILNNTTNPPSIIPLLTGRNQIEPDDMQNTFIMIKTGWINILKCIFAVFKWYPLSVSFQKGNESGKITYEMIWHTAKYDGPVKTVKQINIKSWVNSADTICFGIKIQSNPETKAENQADATQAQNDYTIETLDRNKKTEENEEIIQRINDKIKEQFPFPTVPKDVRPFWKKMFGLRVKYDEQIQIIEQLLYDINTKRSARASRYT